MTAAVTRSSGVLRRDGQFATDSLERLDVERLLGHDMFEPPVLVLDLLQPLELAEFEAAVLAFQR